MLAMPRSSGHAFTLRHSTAGLHVVALIGWPGLQPWSKHLLLLPRPVTPAQEGVTVP
jgi:hypothetical protein